MIVNKNSVLILGGLILVLLVILSANSGGLQNVVNGSTRQAAASNAKDLGYFNVSGFDVEVPDTLDLAERGKVAVNALTRFLDPDHNYMPYSHARFNVRPPYLDHIGDGVDNWGKVTEALIEMRLMSGSTQNLDVDKKTLEG